VTAANFNAPRFAGASRPTARPGSEFKLEGTPLMVHGVLYGPPVRDGRRGASNAETGEMMGRTRSVRRGARSIAAAKLSAGASNGTEWQRRRAGSTSPPATARGPRRQEPARAYIVGKGRH